MDFIIPEEHRMIKQLVREFVEKEIVPHEQEAEETEDVINVFNQLVYYREQIELVKGQIEYYDEAAALSSISVRVLATETVQPLVIGKWQPKGVYLEAVQNLINFLQGYVNFMIRFIINYLPVLVLVFLPFYLVFLGLRAIFRRTRKPKPEQPVVVPEPKKK